MKNQHAVFKISWGVVETDDGEMLALNVTSDDFVIADPQTGKSTEAFDADLVLVDMTIGQDRQFRHDVGKALMDAMERKIAQDNGPFQIHRLEVNSGDKES